jgi:hypothetical protein
MLIIFEDFLPFKSSFKYRRFRFPDYSILHALFLKLLLNDKSEWSKWYTIWKIFKLRNFFLSRWCFQIMHSLGIIFKNSKQLKRCPYASDLNLRWLWWLSGGMTPCTSESWLISLYIKYLYGLLVQPGYKETILMGRISAQKKIEHLNCFSHAVELLWMCNWTSVMIKLNFDKI